MKRFDQGSPIIQDRSSKATLQYVFIIIIPGFASE